MVPHCWHQHSTQNEHSDPYWGLKWYPGQALVEEGPEKTFLRSPSPSEVGRHQGLGSRPCSAPALGSSSADPHPWQLVDMEQRGWGEIKWEPGTGLALDLATPMAKAFLERPSCWAGARMEGSIGHRGDAEHQRWLSFPVPSCTATLYTRLFISVQNHFSIIHKKHPTLYPTLSPHISTLPLRSIPPGGGC